MSNVPAYEMETSFTHRSELLRRVINGQIAKAEAAQRAQMHLDEQPDSLLDPTPVTVNDEGVQNA